MKPRIHADNISDKIIALQHPSETLPQFIARCDALRAAQGAPVEAVQEEQPTYCDDCGGFGHVLDGAQKFKCITCKGTGVKA
ncbi:hypothetical protein [Xylella phage Cota]|uniref:Uncharacterized protein n=1 Tax=Xylella phage Cota TaxID=2699877 RepID=A0A6F8ZK88_9CAUD|nr:hypothetical protein [Xylella phage Cota]